MPRPCAADHPPTPDRCRLCWWCGDTSAKAAAYRRLWGEPAPHPAPPREFIPGIPDPLPGFALAPVPHGWAHDPGVIARHAAALAALARTPLAPPPRRGTGVVLFGGGKWWPGNVVAVRMLRDTGCRLPVQIWHRGADEPVRPRDLADDPGVTVHDLTAVHPAPRRLVGWEAKTLALLGSGLERIFFHDADAYCLADPAPLLDRLSPAEPFLYWEDLPAPGGHVRWATWGLDGDHIPPVLGGQCAIHMTHFWREFVLAHWLDQHSEFSYVHQFGDQDSWRVALAATGGRYTRLGPSVWEGVGFRCDYDGRPMVVHRCQAKMFFPEDVAPGDRMSNRRLDRLPGEARAWGYFDALQAARTAAEVFGRLHERGAWGPGQSPASTGPYLEAVNALARVAGWRRVADLGCGDGSITSRLEAPGVVGVDCHAPHVERLRRRYPEREWLCLDLDRDRDALPAGDAALLKDVLHHWPNRLVRDWLTWARGCGKWRWIVCTQSRAEPGQRDDCPLGGFRGLSPESGPLRGLGLRRVCDAAGKSVLLLPAGG